MLWNKDLEFSLKEYIMLIIFLLIAGDIACIYQLASKANLTPEVMFNQVWTVTVTFILSIGLILGLGNLYYKKKAK